MKTGKLYSKLFSDYSDKQFQHSVNLQIDRFNNWGLPIKGSRCLDVGCGGGRTLVALKTMGATEVVGIDIDKNLIKLANERSGCKTMLDSALNIPFEDKSFDLIICSGVLHHTESIEKGLQELRRVLKDKGTAYILLYKKHPIWIGTFIMRIVSKVISFPTMQKLISFLPPNKRYTKDNWYVEYFTVWSEKKIKKVVGKYFNYKEVDKGKPAHNIRLVLN